MKLEGWRKLWHPCVSPQPYPCGAQKKESYKEIRAYQQSIEGLRAITYHMSALRARPRRTLLQSVRQYLYTAEYRECADSKKGFERDVRMKKFASTGTRPCVPPSEYMLKVRFVALTGYTRPVVGQSTRNQLIEEENIKILTRDDYIGLGKKTNKGQLFDLNDVTDRSKDTPMCHLNMRPIVGIMLHNGFCCSPLRDEYPMTTTTR